VYRASYGQFTNSATGEKKKTENHTVTYKGIYEHHIDRV